MRAVLRGLAIVGVLLGFSAGIASAQAVEFLDPPTIGDRKITWSWEPIPGRDPYFLGNTVLERSGDDLLGVISSEIRMLKASPDGSLLYAVGNADDQIHILEFETGALVRSLPAPPSGLLDFDVHRSGLLILGGLDDGRVAVWDLREDAPELLDVVAAQAGPCEAVRFLVSSTDVEEQRFVSAGAGGGVQVWYEPGNLLRELTEGDVLAIDVTRNASYVAVADTEGAVRVYEPIEGGFLSVLAGHQSAVKQIIFSEDQRWCFTLDETGRIFVWSSALFDLGDPPPTYDLQIDNINGLRIGLRQPDAALLYTLDATGYYQIFDGFDGRLYRDADLTDGETVFAHAFDQLGRHLYLGTEGASIRTYRTGFCTPSVIDTVCFGGYEIWRSETPNAEDASMIRVFGFGDSTWSFAGIERTFVDPDSLIPRGANPEEPLAGPHNGAPYYYSIIAFERRYLGGSVYPVQLNTVDEGFYRRDPMGDPTPVTPHRVDRTNFPLLDDIIVVPNPYEAGNVPWDAELGEHIEFRHLPAQATIRIYTVAGDLLRILEHGPAAFGEPTDARSWDLKNAQGERVASGVYLYHVSTELNAEEAEGYFIIVR